MGGVCLPQVAEEAEADFARAQEKYEESRRIKSDYYDAYVSLGNLDFERGKLALGLAVPPPQCALTSLQFLILDPVVPQTMIITMALLAWLCQFLSRNSNNGKSPDMTILVTVQKY